MISGNGQTTPGAGDLGTHWEAANSSSGGGYANATNGGLGGKVPSNWGASVGNYNGNTSNGASATDYGLAGAGGGGGAPGGAGGNGGNGAPGVCIITWRSQ